MQLGILKALVPIDIATIQSQNAQDEKSQSNADQNQHNWRWPTHAASRGGTVCISRASLALGTSGIVSFLRSRARVDVLIP